MIAAAGMMWQLGKMALTGQTKHAGRAMVGWVENMLLSAVGVSMFALLLVLGDALTAGLVERDVRRRRRRPTTGSSRSCVPASISNPITLLCIVAVLLLVGFIQLVMIFLAAERHPHHLPAAARGRRGPGRR